MNFIFDFDGTIVDSMPAFIAVFNKTIRENKNPLSAEEIQQLRGMSSRRALKHIGIRWWQIPKLILQGLPDFRALLPSLHPFPDLPDTFKQLTKRGDKLFIVTSNTEASVNEFLDQHQLAGYFTAIDTGAGVFKKSKHIRALIKSQNLKRHETVYVGDETRDIQAARMARIQVAAVIWGFNTRSILSKRRPNFVIDKPQGLLDISL